MGAVPNDILAVLRRAGLLEFGDRADRRAADRRRVVRHLARRPAAGVRLRQAGAGQAAGQGGLARAGRAQRLRGRAGCGIARGVVPAAAPELLFEDPGRGRRGDALPPARPTIALWKELLRDGEADAGVRRRGRRAARRGSTPPPPGVPRSRQRFRPMRIFHDIRLEPYLIATGRAHPAAGAGAAPAGAAHGHDQAGAGPWRREPEEHPGRAGGAGVPRCRMRLVRRSGVRSRLLPQPSAAEVLVDARRRAGLPRLLRQPARRLSGGSPGSRAPALEARAAGLLPGLFLARIDGKSPVEYVTDMTDKERVRRIAGAFLLAPSETLAPLREAWAVELGL